MSVGHIARKSEAEGLPTVTVMVRSFRHVAEEMKFPRTVITRHPMGRPLGPPEDVATHRRVVGAALDLLDTTTEGGIVIELEQPYRPH